MSTDSDAFVFESNVKRLRTDSYKSLWLLSFFEISWDGSEVVKQTTAKVIFTEGEYCFYTLPVTHANEGDRKQMLTTLATQQHTDQVLLTLHQAEYFLACLL